LAISCQPTSNGGATGSPAPTGTVPRSTGSVTVGVPTPTPTSTGTGSTTRHYEYVFPDGEMDVFDMDNNHTLVKHISLPQTMRGVRGVVASQTTHMLYISYGGDGGSNGNGSMLKYDLLMDQVVWTKSYPHGIDSMAISP